MHVTRLLRLLLLSLWGIMEFPLTHWAQSPPVRQFVTVAGKKMCYTSSGLKDRKPGEPVIVFEAGFSAAGTLVFNTIFPAVTKIAPTVAYDRNAEGQSELDTTLTTDADIAKRLHALLQAIHVPPPYVLIGHSMGGPYIRLFTALYPNDVKALVFLDPTYFSLTDQQLATLTRISPPGWDLGRSNIVNAAADSLLPPIQHYRYSRLLNTIYKNGYFKEYAALPPLPNIPVAVLLAYNHHSPSRIDSTERQKQITMANDTLNDFRIENYKIMVGNNRDSFVMLLPGFKHFIYEQDPDLITSVIDRIYRKALRPSAPTQTDMQNR